MRHAGVIKNLTSGIINKIQLQQYQSIAKASGKNVSQDDMDLLLRGAGPGFDQIMGDKDLSAKYIKALAEFKDTMGESTKASSLKAYEGNMGGLGNQIIYEQLQNHGSSLTSLEELLKEYVTSQTIRDTITAAENNKLTNDEFRDITTKMADSYGVFDQAVTKFDRAVNTLDKTVLGVVVALGGGLAGSYLWNKYGGKLLEKFKPGGRTPSVPRAPTVPRVPTPGVGVGVGLSAGAITSIGAVGAAGGAAGTLYLTNAAGNSVRDRVLGEIAEEKEQARLAANAKRTEDLADIFKRAKAAGIDPNDKDAVSRWVRAGEPVTMSKEIRNHVVGTSVPVLGSSPTTQNRNDQIQENSVTTGNRNDVIQGLGLGLQKLGIRVSEHKDFGGVTPEVHKGRGHADSRAFDLNFGKAGTSPEERAVFEALKTKLMPMVEEGMLAMIWDDNQYSLGRTKIGGQGHKTHMHLEVRKGFENDPRLMAALSEVGLFPNSQNAISNSSPQMHSSVWGATMDSIKNTVNAITTGKIKDENGNYISVTDQLTPAMLQVVENTLKTKEAVLSNTENRSEVAKENRLMSQYESKTKMEIEGRADQIRESFSNSMAPLSNTFNRIDNILGR